jgi:hypothetical protein
MPIKFKKILPWIALGLILAGIITWLVYRFTTEKALKLVFPNGKETLQAGKTYQISWEAKRLGKVGIVLVKGEGPETQSKWLAKDISAGKKKYDWQIFVWEAPGQDYKIAILEYPWKEGNMIDYSDENFTISGPQFASCDKLSIDSEWTHVPSDFPDLRKAFIAEKGFDGNLGGLEGADKKCQEEAKTAGFEGDWKAFLGDDQTLAKDRLKLDGILIEAKPVATLPEGKTCHRLLGKNFDEFLKKLSDPMLLNQERLEENFLRDLSNLWLGRIEAGSKRDCIILAERYLSMDVSRNYSFTTTCQNWTSNAEKVSTGQGTEYPVCYTPQGARIDALSLAGLSSGLLGKESQTKFFTTSLGEPCYLEHKLLCIQQ